MREEDARSRHEKARPSEAMFIQAGNELTSAIKALESVLPAAPESAKAMLARDLKQLKFDAAVNVYDQARTYIDRSKFAVDAERTKTMGRARDAFKQMRTNDGSETDWLANAWLMKIAMELTTPTDVNTYYEYVMKYKDDKASQAAIQPALRLVRYFALQDVTLGRPDESETIGGNAIATKAKSKLTPIQRLHKVQNDGEAWLKAYADHHRTYEGQGVLFEVAMAHFIEAREDKKASPDHIKKALERFEELASLDGDLAERARQITFVIKLEHVKTTKSELRTFDEFFLKAMLERRNVLDVLQKLDDPKLDDKDGLEAQRKTHLREVIKALNKALALATPSTPVAKVDDARYYLCGAYFAAGDPLRAAVVAEVLGRSKTTRRSAEGIATAIQMYAGIADRNPRDAATRQRLHDLAEFVLANEKLWGADPATGLAHYHLGLAAREQNPKKAIAHLAKLPPDFTDYIYTQGQLVFIAEAAREKAEDPKDKAFYIAAAKSAINRMPKFNAATDSGTVILMYFLANLEMANYLYMDAMAELNAKEELKAIKNCNDMAAFVRGLQGDLDKVSGSAMSAKNREQVELSIRVWLKYSSLGLAEVKFRGKANDRYDQVLEATKSVVDETLAAAKKVGPTGKIALRDFKVTAGILNLALRASVQKGDLDKAKMLLDVVQRLTGADKEETAGNVVAVLLSDIAGQLRKMSEANDPNLKATKGHYTAFLDLIAKEYESKGLDTGSAMLLATAYNSLEYPCKAATLFAKVKAPASLDKRLPAKTGKETPIELEARQKAEEELNRYWAIQLDYLRALRACKEKDSLDVAYKAAEAMIKHENGRFQFQAKMERNLIVEEQEKYRQAFGLWQIFMNKEPALSNNLARPEVRQLYFTGYVHWTRSLYLTATKDKDIKDRTKLIKSAANMILKLETATTKEGWEIAQPLFEKMLKDPDFESLKKEYDFLKKDKKGAALPRRQERESVAAVLFGASDPAHPVCTDPKLGR
jgi:hypothetical protein